MTEPGFDDPRVQQGIDLFNSGQYFACHDVFEDYWSELTCPEKSLFQGLIQAAVALFHFEEGNLGGALRMYTSSRMRLLGFRDGAAGIDVARLLRDMECCFQELCQPHQGYPFHVRLNPELVPQLHRLPPFAATTRNP